MAPEGVIAWRGFQLEWPNPKGVGLEKLLVPREHVLKNGQRAWEGLVMRSSKLCKLSEFLPKRKAVEERKAPVASPTTSMSSATTAKVANAVENGSRFEMQQQGATQIRVPDQFRMPEVNSGGAVTKEDLGRATWTFLHTLAAQFPEKPTRQQQRDVRELMSIMTRLYPCRTCAEHFKEVLKAYPVKADSGVELAQWMCQVHNVVNRSLGKPQFPCQRVDARWGELHCDEGACDLEGRLLYR